MSTAGQIIQKCQERALRFPRLAPPRDRYAAAQPDMASGPSALVRPQAPGGLRTPEPLRPARVPHTGHALYDPLMRSHDRVASRRVK